MKAIYTTLNNTVYKVNQTTNVPTIVSHSPMGVSSSMEIDTANKAVSQRVHINTLEKPGVKSNKELFVEMVEFLKEKQVTEIKTIQDFYKVYIDYSMFEDGHEIEHCVVIKPIDEMDQMYPLGVATNNECVYRRVKVFKPSVSFTVRNQLPHGIMKTPRKSCQLKINNIVIFQDFSDKPDIHQSTYSVPYSIGSTTVQGSLEDAAMIYSTENAGIELEEISVNFIPRMITVSLDITLSNYIVAYSDEEVNAILIQNIEDKYSEDDNDDAEVPDDNDDPGILIPDTDNKPSGDGNNTPNEDGYFDFYERCQKTTPDALLVVEDLIPDGSYNIETMIRKAMVIPDIPDIEVGEYVVYRESFVSV